MALALELALYALAWAAALAIGGVHATTQVALAAASLALLVATALGPLRGQGLRLSPPVWVMFAALAWTALQLVPLPLGLLRILDGNTASLRGDLGATWAPVTLDAAATALELAKGLTYTCLFLVGNELLRGRDATRRAAAALALFGVLLAVSIAAHRALGADRLFGFYAPRSHPGTGIFPPFVNGGHAASVLALGALAAFGLAAATERARRLAWLIAGSVAVAALLTTGSRGGVVGLVLGAYVLGGALAVSRFGRARGIGLATVLLIALAGGALGLAQGLRNRFVETKPGDTRWSTSKTRGWGVAARLAARDPWVGVGRGAFEQPAAALRLETANVRLIYAENVVLQVAGEWGLPVGLALLVAALLTMGTLALRAGTDPVTLGLAGGAVAIALHGLVDCGFEMPGVMCMWIVALSALAARAEADRRVRRRARPRMGTIGVAGVAVAGVAIVIASARAVPHTLDAEAAALREALHARALPTREVVAAIVARHPASADVQALAGDAALRRRDPDVLRQLGRAMWLQPSLPRPHFLAAFELIRLRRPAQAALEMRLAAERGQIVADADLVRWLGPFAVDAVARDGDAVCHMAATYAVLQRWDDAEHAYARAEELGATRRARRDRMVAYAAAPRPVRLAAAERLAGLAESDDELALAAHALGELGLPDRVDALLKAGLERFPASANLVAEAARALAARGDLDGARRMVARVGRFDSGGRVKLAELTVELAQRAGDLDGTAAARARLKVLRARADLEQPGAGSTP